MSVNYHNRNYVGWVNKLVFPFVNGTAYDDSGWDIDVPAEYATAFIHLPVDLQTVIWIRIYARSMLTEAHGMALTITANGGASNEAYNTEAISIADKISETLNFTADDIIYWEIDSGDDADIGHLTGGDSVEFKVVGQAAVGDNCATDARFRCVEIYY